MFCPEEEKEAKPTSWAQDPATDDLVTIMPLHDFCPEEAKIKGFAS